jgi:hypothetical protein
MEATFFAGANLAGVSFADAYWQGHELCDDDMPDENGQF